MTAIVNGHIDQRGILSWFAATLAAAVATALMVTVGADATTAGMVFLLLVVSSAAVTEVRLSLYIAAICAVSFDYFFLPPLHTFAIVGAQQWVALFTFVMSCAVVSRLAERARRQARQAEQRRGDVERLY
ncbi:MAG: DUF4118 domain-containing protein, partial [Terracidiphilus sp.]